MASFDVIDLEGPPRERGVVHGEALADEIETNVDTYLTRFAHEGVDPDAAREQADEFVPLIDSANAEYAAEMRGVAEGSGVPLTDVALLNVRYEVIYTAWKERTERQAEGDTASDAVDSDGDGDGDARDVAGAGVDGCTSYGVLPTATADGKTYMGQNWDWLAPIAETIVLTRVQRATKPDHLVFTEAGIVGGKAGVNEHGIGVGLNGLTSPDDGRNPFRKPIHVRLREVMDAERLDEAMAPIVETHRPASANVMLGAADGGGEGGSAAGSGEVIDLETAPERFAHLHPTDGVLTHANHFVDDGIESLTERRSPSTLYRGERLRRHLEADRDDGGVTVEGIKAGLRDHFGRPSSVCSHVDESLPEEEYGQTNASFVIDLTDRRLHAVRGPPCSGEYESFDLAG